MPANFCPFSPNSCSSLQPLCPCIISSILNEQDVPLNHQICQFHHKKKAYHSKKRRRNRYLKYAFLAAVANPNFPSNFRIWTCRYLAQNLATDFPVISDFEWADNILVLITHEKITHNAAFLTEHGSMCQVTTDSYKYAPITLTPSG
jgi:hypothetical protein